LTTSPSAAASQSLSWSISVGARALADTLDPGGEVRVVVAERLLVGEDHVEELGVVGGAVRRLLQERVGDAVGGTEGVPEQVLAAG